MTPRLKVIRRLVTRSSYVLLVEALMRSDAGPQTGLIDETDEMKSIILEGGRQL